MGSKNTSIAKDELIGPYVVVRKIGEGGMGEVYEAIEPKLNRTVAIKVIKSQAAESDEAIERFFREAQALARINHPNIITVYALDSTDDLHYIAMELVHGRSLHDFIINEFYNVGDVIHVFEQLIAGMNFAHNACIIHRDLKPKNILLTSNEIIKIVDFGIAKLFDSNTDNLTRAGEFIGTLRYVAPEIVMGEKPTFQADIFSLGVILYEVITEFSPFAGENDLKTIENLKKKEVKFNATIRGLVPEGLLKIIIKMIQKNPSNRYQNLREVNDDLMKIKAGMPNTDIFKPSVRGKSVTNLEEVLSAVKLLEFEPFEVKIVMSLAITIQTMGSTDAMESVEDTAATVAFSVSEADGEAGETAMSPTTGATIGGPQITISDETLLMALKRYEEIKERSGLGTVNDLLVDGEDQSQIEVGEIGPSLQLEGKTAPQVTAKDNSRVNNAVPGNTPRTPMVSYRASVTGGSRSMATGGHGGGTSDWDQVQHSTSVRVQMLKRETNKDDVIQKMSIKNSGGPAAFASSTSYLMLLVTLGIFGFGGYVYLESKKDSEKPVAIEQPIQTEQDYESEYIEEEAPTRKVAAVVSVDSTLLLPKLKPGSDFIYERTSGPQGKPVVNRERLRYSVVHSNNAFIYWKLRNSPKIKTSHAPFLGNLELANVGKHGNPNYALSSFDGNQKSLFPIKVGNSMVLGRPEIGSTYECRVLGKEKRITDAGPFDVFKVQCLMKNSSLPRSDTFYYAPQLKHWVARTTVLSLAEGVVKEYNYKLISYDIP